VGYNLICTGIWPTQSTALLFDPVARWDHHMDAASEASTSQR
jgi:hypothetical protein